MEARMLEADTRLIPYQPWEFDWIKQRPAPHRTPLPQVGDEVCFRPDYWLSVERAEVVAIQPLDDLDDPHLWTVELDGFGQPLMVDGRPLISQRLDPWLTLWLKLAKGVRTHTREARLRGSPGWLPLDWESRYRPMPQFTVVR